MSLTMQEIKSQYAALRQTFDYMQSKRDDIVAFLRGAAPSTVAFVGCGSSYCLSEAAAFSFRLRAGVPSFALAGGDLLLHRERYAPLLRDALIVAPSRSGSTSEVVEALRLVAEAQRAPSSDGAARRARTLAISCVTDSPLSRQADFALELPWAFDHSVCQTRTVTNLYAADLLLSAFAGGDEALIEDVRSAIALGEAYMARVEAPIRAAADFGWTNAVVLADGELYGLAAEGAIALTEIARMQAHAHHLLDVRHGPMVTVGPDTLVVATVTKEDGTFAADLLRDVKSRGATVVAFADPSVPLPAAHVDCAVVFERALDPAALGIPFLFIPQIAAVCAAERQGVDPDRPDGLTAWIKL